MAVFALDAAVNLSAPDLAYSAEQSFGLVPAYSAAGEQGGPMQRPNVADANFGAGDGLSLFPFFEAGEASPVEGETSIRARDDGAYNPVLATIAIPLNALTHPQEPFTVCEGYHVPAALIAALGTDARCVLWGIKLPNPAFPSAFLLCLKRDGAGDVKWTFRIGATDYPGPVVAADTWYHAGVTVDAAAGTVAVEILPDGGALVADACPGAAFTPGLSFEGGNYLQGHGLLVGGAEFSASDLAGVGHLSRAGLALYSRGRTHGAEEPTTGDLTTFSVDYADAGWVARNANLQGAVFGDPNNEAEIAEIIRVHRYADLVSESEAQSLAKIANVTDGEGVHLNLCYNPDGSQDYPDPAVFAAAALDRLALWVNAGVNILSVGGWNEPDIFGPITPAQAANLTNALCAAVRAAYPALPLSVAEWGHSDNNTGLYTYLDLLTEPYEIITVHNYHKSPVDFERDVAALRAAYPDKMLAQTEGNIHISLERLTPVTTPVNPGRWAWAAAVAVAHPLDLFSRYGADAVPFWTYWVPGENPALVGGDLTATGLVTFEGEKKPHGLVMEFFAGMPARVLPVANGGRAGVGCLLARDAGGSALSALIYHTSPLKASSGASARVRVEVESLPGGLTVASAYRVDKGHASIFESGSAALVDDPEAVTLDATGFGATLPAGGLLLVSLSSAGGGGGGDAGVFGSPIFGGGGPAARRR